LAWLWGAVAGYVGGRLDGVLMRLVDILYSLPSVIFVIVLITTIGQMLKESPLVERSPAAEGALQVILLFVGLGRGFVVDHGTHYTRAGAGPAYAGIRGSQPGFGRGHGADLVPPHHPEHLGVAITYAALTVPAIILYESFLSYLGLGSSRPWPAGAP
jgi:oligopeptide transport system permease protein